MREHSRRRGHHRSRHSKIRTSRELLDHGLDHRGRRQQGITLKIYDNIRTRRQAIQRRGTALCAVAALDRGHHHRNAAGAAGLGDAGVIGCNNHLNRAAHSLGSGLCGLPGIGNRRVRGAIRAGDRCEGLGRKTRRSQPRWNDDCYFCHQARVEFSVGPVAMS